MELDGGRHRLRRLRRLVRPRLPGIGNPSQSVSDGLTGIGQCSGGAPAGGYQARCGPGPRLPLLVVSPFARQNFVSHTPTEQTSILKFIEDNWGLPRIGDSSFDVRAGSLNDMFDFTSGTVAPKLILDPATGLGPGGIITPFPSPSPTPVPSSGPKPQPKPFKLTCKATGAARKVIVKCSATGDDAITVRHR